jgi:cytochrome c oxidase cbb3-type subunit 3
MQIRSTISAAAAILLTAVCVRVAAQNPPPPAAPQGQGAPGRGGGGGGGRQGQGFPSGQRKAADPAVVERGKTLYGVNCRLCHGADLRGGDMGGVNLMRSQLVLSDQEGELIYPVVHNGRNTPGMSPMPPLPMQESDVKAVAAYIHSVAATKVGQGGPPTAESEAKELNIVVGDAAAGKKYFDANCTSCHSATGDLAGIATRYGSPMALQTAWVAGGGGGGRGGRGGGGGPAAPREPKPVTATITTADGQRVEGRLEQIDDFLVTVQLADGTSRTFTRRGAAPGIEIHDPLDGHKKLLVKYTDTDIHDVTAYLVTLK